MKKYGIVFVILVSAAVVGLFLLSALVTMLLVNVVLHYYHATTLNYHSALAITALASLYGIGTNRTAKTKN